MFGFDKARLDLDHLTESQSRVISSRHKNFLSIMAVVFKDLLLTIVILFVNYIRAFFELIVPPKRKSIKGENVLLTGGGHGIGREMALELSKLDATVVVWDINKDGCEKTVSEIKQNGGKAFAYECDITDSSQIRKVASKVRTDVGEINVLINNAGILKAAPLMDQDENDIRKTFEVNTLSHFWMIKEFLPYMMSKNHGHILNVCSMAGFSGQANLTNYCSSKFAAYGFTESLIDELASQGFTGIKVTSLNPMVVDTGLLKTAKANKVCGLLTPNEVALAGIDAMLRNYEIVSVPSKFYYLTQVGHIFPRNAVKVLKQMGDFHVESQLKKKE